MPKTKLPAGETLEAAKSPASAELSDDDLDGISGGTGLGDNDLDVVTGGSKNEVAVETLEIAHAGFKTTDGPLAR